MPYRTADTIVQRPRPSALRRAWWAVRRVVERCLPGTWIAVYRQGKWVALSRADGYRMLIDHADIPPHWRWALWGET